MEEWQVNLIVGLITTILGFIAGFITKTIFMKNKQIIKGDNNNQKFEVNNNGKK